MNLLDLLIAMGLGLSALSAAFVLSGWQARQWTALLNQTRPAQELHAVGDLITQHLRETTPSQPAQAPSPMGKPYWQAFRTEQSLWPLADQSASTLEIGLPLKRAWRLRAGTLEMKIASGSWQALTDPGSLVVTKFQVSRQTHQILLPQLCSRPCTDLSPQWGLQPDASVAPLPCPPRWEQAQVTLQIQAKDSTAPAHQAPTSVQRVAGVGQGQIWGQCP